jgi:ApbE superfamily uncharacterized protein (UPF0280 family)
VSSIVPDNSGNLFLADEGTNVILEITTNGVISTYAGGGPPKGNLHFAEPFTIRRITTKGTDAVPILHGIAQPIRIFAGTSASNLS